MVGPATTEYRRPVAGAPKRRDIPLAQSVAVRPALSEAAEGVFPAADRTRKGLLRPPNLYPSAQQGYTCRGLECGYALGEESVGRPHGTHERDGDHVGRRPADAGEVLARVCAALSDRDKGRASGIARAEYPYTTLAGTRATFPPSEALAVFLRDGFIDRYSGHRLVFPAALRLV